ncbi:MAG TPA: FUN14 domain-containing protein, partial [Burkholderiales bacterium]|nr:FUN14 domain-containing protein [Burkholderiales bacterium]
MWFVGMIVGAVLGTMIGFVRDVEVTLVIGAVAGLFIGLAFQKTRAVVNAKWKRDVEDALKELHRRVKAMEGASRADAPIAESAPRTGSAHDLSA